MPRVTSSVVWGLLVVAVSAGIATAFLSNAGAEGVSIGDDEQLFKSVLEWSNGTVAVTANVFDVVPPHAVLGDPDPRGALLQEIESMLSIWASHSRKEVRERITPDLLAANRERFGDAFLERFVEAGRVSTTESMLSIWASHSRKEVRERITPDLLAANRERFGDVEDILLHTLIERDDGRLVVFLDTIFRTYPNDGTLLSYVLAHEKGQWMLVPNDDSDLVQQHGMWIANDPATSRTR